MLAAAIAAVGPCRSSRQAPAPIRRKGMNGLSPLGASARRAAGTDDSADRLVSKAREYPLSVHGTSEGAAMTIERSAPRLQILARCACPASARAPRVGIRQVSNQAWTTMRALTYHATVQDLAGPEGSGGARTREQNRTSLEDHGVNFASVPRAFASSIPRYGRHPPAAVLHDHLCRVDQPDRLGTPR